MAATASQVVDENKMGWDGEKDQQQGQQQQQYADSCLFRRTMKEET